MKKKTKRHKPEPIHLRIGKGCLLPAWGKDAQLLRDRKYHIGDVVSAVIRKPRNPKFHRLVHQFGALLANSHESFHGMQAHDVIKRLQWEANIGCTEMQVMVPNVGLMTVRIPMSISFENMDEGKFQIMYRDFTRHVAENYWPDMTPEEIQQMAAISGDEG